MDASIPVDLFNPGQVFACLGFLEAAEILLGGAEAGFDWSDEAKVRFSLNSPAASNPFEVVLTFLAETQPSRWGPLNYVDPPRKKGTADDKDEAPGHAEKTGAAPPGSPTFPAKTAERMSLPIRIGGGNRPLIELGHWSDGSSRDDFKLYSGNRSAEIIARAMLTGVFATQKDKKNSDKQSRKLKFKGVKQLWEMDRDKLIAEPFDVLTPMGGSFNFDPRGAWTSIDAGYSPNEHQHAILASPVVEFLAAWGLENARPDQPEPRKVRYAAWGVHLPPMLARATLGGSLATIPQRRFGFTLNSSGKNKVVSYAQEEPQT